MDPNAPTTEQDQAAGGDPLPGKHCSRCNQIKPLSHFLRRSGKRAGKSSRRGTCRSCRKQMKSEPEPLPPTEPKEASASAGPPLAETPKRRTKRPMPPLPPKPEGPDASVLVPTRQGIIRMRGKTDKGRRWHQETDLETAVTLVRELAAIVVNRHTIRRIYSNKNFRRYILTRDNYTCHFCGEYGDTIDHLLPRAKGGHTTPANCVCACSLCNQSKADRSLDEFTNSFED
ncbi:HNH endonuclease [Paenibacillus oceani]|uniref:HNH endonuclease n=1 Tax=Paenibacillus oceani TaxID=2772510 RepID=A0A927H2Q8_9BACL|nr:HNH endonuclease [Paenibacillus oceani]